MGSWQHLNEFIGERLTAAAVEIFGAVEKTLSEFQGEISRSKREIEHLRALVSRPEVKLHRSDHRVSAPCTEEEASPEHCLKEDSTAHVLPEPPSVLHIIEEHEQRAAQQGGSCRQQSDATRSPEFITRGDCEEQVAGVEADPCGDEFLTSTCGINGDSEVQLKLEDPLELTCHKKVGTQPDWSHCQDRNDPHPPQVIKVEESTSSSSEEEADCEPHSLTLSSSHSLSNKAFNTAEKDVDSCKWSGVSQSARSQNKKNIEGLVKAVTPVRTRQRKKKNEEKKYACSFCSKRFKESNNLKDHVRIHTGEKPYNCKECGMNFRQRGALTVHMRIHTGEQPYQCTECGRRFSRKGSLDSHAVTHIRERPHPCLLCGKSFIIKNSLKKHMEIHAEDGADYTQPL